jgi:hypothetical protein
MKNKYKFHTILLALSTLLIHIFKFVNAYVIRSTPTRDVHQLFRVFKLIEGHRNTL